MDDKKLYPQVKELLYQGFSPTTIKETLNYLVDVAQHERTEKQEKEVGMLEFASKMVDIIKNGLEMLDYNVEFFVAAKILFTLDHTTGMTVEEAKSMYTREVEILSGE